MITFDQVIQWRTDYGPLGGIMFGFWIMQYLLPLMIAYGIGFRQGNKMRGKEE